MHMRQFLQWLSLHEAEACARTQSNQFCATCEIYCIAAHYLTPDIDEYYFDVLVESTNNSINAATEVYRPGRPEFNMLNAVEVRDVESQQDAAEFMNFLISELEANFAEDLAQPPDFNQLFSFRMMESWSCAAGHGDHGKLVPQRAVINVPVVTNKHEEKTLEEDLMFYLKEHFFRTRAPRTVDPDVCASCCTNGIERDISMRFVQDQAPQYLIFQLACFTGLATTTKVLSNTGLPLTLDLSEYTDPADKLYYKLVANVGHLGESLVCGHYVATVVDQRGQCYKISDESVEDAIDYSELQLPNYNDKWAQPYLVTYERCCEKEFDDLVKKQQELDAHVEINGPGKAQPAYPGIGPVSDADETEDCSMKNTDDSQYYAFDICEDEEYDFDIDEDEDV